MVFRRKTRKSQEANRSHLYDAAKLADKIEDSLAQIGSRKLREMAIAAELDQPGSWLPSMLRDYLTHVRHVDPRRPA